MKTTIYLCGPLSNMPGLNKDEFLKAEMFLKEQGFKVINPHDLIEGLDLHPENDYEAILKICVSEMITTAHEVVTLKDAINSPFASREVTIARLMNIPVSPITKYIKNGIPGNN